MNISEKTRETRPRDVESQPFITRQRNSRKSKVLPDNFFHDKKGA